MSIAHETAWAAGFFDGEGYVNIQRRHQKYNGKSYRGHYLRIGINHVAPEPLVEMQRLFGGSIEKQSLESVRGSRKPRHRWVTSSSNAKEALIRMLPYMKNKNKVAALGIDFQTKCLGSVDSRPRITSENLEQREWYKAEISRLNKLD
jgi:hypothetical protein